MVRCSVSAMALVALVMAAIGCHSSEKTPPVGIECDSTVDAGMPCQCYLKEGANELSCKARAAADFCCASAKWPNDGICFCGTWTCLDDATYSECGCGQDPSPQNGDPATACESRGACCFASSQCVCGGSFCDGSFPSVDTCNISTPMCPAEQPNLVDHCN